ncbi:MAG: hypothetical protein WB792_00630 [Desulfobacterales bacterium]
MAENDVFYTRTMAKVYADQGNLKKAEKIYKYLLAHEPGQQDLIEALSEIEKQRTDSVPDDLMELFIQWIDLLLLRHNLQKLTKFRMHLKGGR